MKSIFTVKELIAALENGDVKVGENVCVTGEVFKKDFGTRKLIYTLKWRNAHITCFDSNKDNKEVVKINKPLYVDGVVGVTFGMGFIIEDINSVDRNVKKQQFLRIYEAEKTDQNLLYLLMVSGDEEEAIKLLNISKNIELNALCQDEELACLAIKYATPKVFNAIINHKDFKAKGITDGFGDTLMTSLMYLYGPNSNDELAKEYIDSLVSCGRFDFNETNIHNETALMVSCMYPSLIFMTKILCEMEDIDLNVKNDFGNTALDCAIDNKNIGAIRMLMTRNDLIISDKNKESIEKLIG